jgi:hypothetical protein
MKRFVTLTAVLLLPLLLLAIAPKERWFLAGSRPAEYDCHVDPQASYNDQESTYLGLKEGIHPTGFGTWMTQFDAAPFLGKRVRLTANVRAEGVKGWAGLWMRVDDQSLPPNARTIAFDNMQNRSIKGSKPWKSYSVVLDVPEHATGIFLGILLDGSGGVWLNGVNFEVVDQKVHSTNTLVRRPMY